VKLSDLSELQYVKVGLMMEDTLGDSTILATDRVSDAVSLIARRPNSALAVTTTEGTLIGIVSEKDIILALQELGPQALDAAIETVMTKNPITCDAEDTCEKVLATMIRGNFRNVPINKNNEFSGIAQIVEVSAIKMSKLIEENSKLKKLVQKLLPSELIFSPQDDIVKAKASMDNHGFPCVIVASKEKIEAVISDKDFLTSKSKTDSIQALSSQTLSIISE
jgi:CBS domain-containing protein